MGVVGVTMSHCRKESFYTLFLALALDLYQAHCSQPCTAWFFFLLFVIMPRYLGLDRMARL